MFALYAGAQVAHAETVSPPPPQTAQTPPTPPTPIAQILPVPTTGRIERLENFSSRHVAARHIDIWLPTDFSSAKRYQVLYMHDGQNLFDGRLTWSKSSWRADVAVERLVKAGRIADTIIVGIWNNGPERYAEYFPERMLAFAPESMRREYIVEASN